jgi:hypothetical protein
MRTFRARRWRNLAVLCAACLLVVFAYQTLVVSLRPTNFYTGWALFGLMLVLAAYNLFKKLPFLPLGMSSTWLQFHIYLGWFTVLLFALHLGTRVPQKPLGLILTALYLTVAASGILGLALSRFFAPRLTARGQEVLFERIPARMRRLQGEVEELVLRSVTLTNSSSIADFYSKYLKAFFDGPRHFWRHLLNSELPRRALLAEAEHQQHYMNKEEQAILNTLTDQVRTKDDLDYQYALQATLKYWLFVHVPLSYSLLIFSAFHVLLVYAFAGVTW